MKYLFINVTAGYGSTGRIAADQCRALMAQGHECLLAYGRYEVTCPDVPVIRIGGDLDKNINALLNRVFDNQCFGTKRATREFLKKVRAYAPDVIYLHNIHGYYLHAGLLFDYLRTCGKPIFWTLHDCWAFTGHCVHFDFVGCEKWKTGCHDCPQLKEYPRCDVLDGSRRNYLRKKETFTGIPGLTLLVPSNWLKEKVEESFLKEYPVEVHYNQVDRQVFRPSQSDFREKHHLEEKIILLGVASNWKQRKGFEDFIALSELLDRRFQIVMVGLDREEMEKIPSSILGLPRTNNLQQLAEIYSAADFYLNPSVEETFGMTVLEAQCCGTTSIVYEGTAAAEIAGKYGGIVVPRGPQYLKQAVEAQISEKRN